MADRFDRFTKRARSALKHAHDEANRLKHHYIGTEHLLLGLLKEKNDVAVRALQELDVDLGLIQGQIEESIGRGQRLRFGKQKFTPRFKRLVELAFDEADQLGHHYIDTEHLLLGLLREGEGIANDVLRSFVSLADVRAKMNEIMNLSPANAGREDVPANLAEARTTPKLWAEIRAKIAEITQRPLTTETASEKELLKEHLRDILAQLTDHERQILERRFGLADGQEHTPEEVGRAFGIRRERIQQIEAKALRKLQHVIRQKTGTRDPVMSQIYEIVSREERNRLARDLHDSIKQQIFSISVSAAAVEARWENDPEGARAALRDVQHSAQVAMVEMNALLQQLRPDPLETVGLLEALREQCEALDLRTGAEVTTVFGDLPSDEQLPLGAQETIFRIAQEAFGNIARHARAAQVKVRLEPDVKASGVKVVHGLIYKEL